MGFGAGSKNGKNIAMRLSAATVLGVALAGAACSKSPEKPTQAQAEWVKKSGAQAQESWAKAARHRMVDFIAHYSPEHRVTNERVLEAMRQVPRHKFVPEASVREAYRDTPLPIGEDQTISQPFIVGFMTQALEPAPNDRVLEIGTGSGYQAAVLAELVKEVYTIEIIEILGRRAENTLKDLGYSNISVRIGDGYRGWPEKAPFDAIIVTCAPERIPKPLVDQLAVGGRMIIPVGPESGPWTVQELILVRKTAEGMKRDKRMDVRFVPMTGEVRRPRSSPD